MSGADQVQEVPSESTTAAADNQCQPTVTTATEISPAEAEATDSDDSV